MRLTLPALLACSVASPALAQAHGGLLFHVGGDDGATADIAAGAAMPVFAAGVEEVPDGAQGPGLAMSDRLTLAWSAPGNIFAARGTLSFFVRPRAPLDASPVVLFRVGAAESTSWDATFLRVDWNGHGFDAFVTDASLARVRVSTTQDNVPAADRWTHVAFAWDEAEGVTLWVDGRRVAHRAARAMLDQSLFGFGPFQRIVSAHQVQSAYNHNRAGDMDEISVWDRALTDAEVAQLAAGQLPAVAATGQRDDARLWTQRFGWDRITGPSPQGPVLAVRKVEFADTRDGPQKLFRGADGIRETTWPGVYNRSALPGRTDYFVLPDWNTYSTAGREYTLTLPEEPWNQLEVTGAAAGRAILADGDTVLDRPAGVQRTSTRLRAERTGGTLTFRNAVPEVPIQEIAAYRVTGMDALPAGRARLTYRIDPAADPAGYPSLAPTVMAIGQRHPAGERATLVALPAGAPVVAAPAAPAPGLPIVHLLVPATFRDQPPGEAPRRFSYGWDFIDGGLDGVALELPPLALATDADGLAPLNIRLHDPLWPDRDLIDVNVRVRPGERQTVWLDSRDRILPTGLPLSLTLAAADPRFGPAMLAGTGISLLFKPRAEASPEHVADRLEQARDNLANLVEEQPSTRLYPVWDRFERDVTDVLRVDPGSAPARSLWLEKNAEQVPASLPPAAPVPPGVPEWAFRQTEVLRQYRHFVDWWIDHRQLPDGEFGGGLSDDTDLVNQWVGLALMGVAPDRYRASQAAVLDATHANGMWHDGLSAIQADHLHSYEEGINALAQAMMLDWGNPRQIERAMQVARNYPRLIRRNAQGHAHFVSAWYSGTQITRGNWLGWQYPYSFLVTHPGLLLADYNGAPAVRRIVMQALDGWLALGTQGADGSWTFPQEIEWATDATRGTGVGNAVHPFWAAWRWTGDDLYLRPLLPRGMSAGSLPVLAGLNADTLAQLPGGPALAGSVAQAGPATGGANDPNLGGVGAAALAQFIRWQQTGDNALLADLYAQEARRNAARWYVLTEAELWSDRVALPSELLQRARMGGVALLRNSYYPGNLVSWRFATGDVAERVGIMIPKGDPEAFRVIAHNMTDRPVTATMVGAMLAPGQWRMSGGVDADGDNRADAPGAEQLVRLERDLGTELMLPPHRTIVFDFALEQPGDDPATRPDIGLSAADLTRRGSGLGITVHSLGAQPTPAGTVTVRDAAGTVLGSARFPALAAPADLLPRTADVRVRLSARAGGALTATLALDGAPAEVTAGNNSAVLAPR